MAITKSHQAMKARFSPKKKKFTNGITKFHQAMKAHFSQRPISHREKS